MPKKYLLLNQDLNMCLSESNSIDGITKDAETYVKDEPRRKYYIVEKLYETRADIEMRLVVDK